MQYILIIGHSLQRQRIVEQSVCTEHISINQLRVNELRGKNYIIVILLNMSRVFLQREKPADYEILNRSIVASKGKFIEFEKTMSDSILPSGFMKFLQDKAQSKKHHAAMDGEQGDGGSQVITDQLACYKAGRDNEIPKIWVKHLEEFFQKTVESNEYAEFLRLKKKFEG